MEFMDNLQFLGEMIYFHLMKALIKIISFVWISVCLFSESSAKTAAVKAYGYQVEFIPTTSSNGATIYFTTYDGSTIYPLNDNNTISNELKPSSAGSSIYRADYLAATNYVFEHGTISLNMPTTDSDGNGVFDWLQQDMAVNAAAVTGSSSVHWLAAGATSGDSTISGQLTRQAGSESGSYSMTYTIVGIGTFIATGTWYVGYVDGSLTYENGSYSISASSSGVSLSGSSTYSSSGTDVLQLGSIQLTDAGGTVSMAASTLSRAGNIYSARVALDDGDYDTSWNDFVDWYLVITDSNDVDADGVPDLTDLSSPSSAQISFNGWNYHAWPWVYNAVDEDWLYYYSGQSGWAMYRNKDKSWYTYDANSKTWLAL